MIRSLTDAWRERAMLRNSVTLISGTVLTQAVLFAFSPVLTRVFPADAFGTLANYNACVAMLSLLSMLRYDQAVVVASGEQRLASVVALTTSLAAAGSLVCAVAGVILWFSYDGGGYLGELRRITPFLPISVFAACVTSTLAQVNVQLGRFRRVAVISVAQMIVMLSVQLALGRSRPHDALILGSVAAVIVAAAVFWLQTMPLRGADVARWSVDELRETAARYADFPRFALTSDALATAVQQFGAVFVLAVFSPVAAGLYSFSMRIVRVPVIIVSAAVTSALRKESSDAVDGAGLPALYSATVKALFIVGILPFTVLLIFGPSAFGAVFGAQWAGAGEIARILSPAILVEFVALPMSVFFVVTATQRVSFRIQLVGFVALVGVILVGRTLLPDFTSTCYLIAGVMMLANGASILAARRVTAPA